MERDKLVEELRHYFDTVPLVLEAADVIEATSDRDEWVTLAAGLAKALMKRRWVSIFEYLPEWGEVVHVAYIDCLRKKQRTDGLAIFCGKSDGAPVWAWKYHSSEAEPDVTHWKRLDDPPNMANWKRHMKPGFSGHTGDDYPL